MLMASGWEINRKKTLHQNNHSDPKKQWDYINIEESKTNIEKMKNINTKGILFIFGMELQNGRLV